MHEQGAQRAARPEELDDKTLQALRLDYDKLARREKSRTRTPVRAEAVPKRPARARKG
jgi:hypothetical protein